MHLLLTELVLRARIIEFVTGRSLISWRDKFLSQLQCLFPRAHSVHDTRVLRDGIFFLGSGGRDALQLLFYRAILLHDRVISLAQSKCIVSLQVRKFGCSHAAYTLASPSEYVRAHL